MSRARAVRALGALTIGLGLFGCSTSAPEHAQPQDIEPVNPSDYLAPWLPPGVESDWTFYTSSNINCRIGGKYLTCIASPGEGLPGAKEYNLAWTTDTKSLLTWSATQAKPWGPPSEPFQANRKGEKLLPPGHSLTVPDGSCAVTANSVIECGKPSGHGFVIDANGSRTY